MTAWKVSWKRMATEGYTEERTLRALGLCAKARKLVMGVPMICEAMQKQRSRPYLVISASDNSENTQKRLRDRCDFYGVEKKRLKVDGDTLARALGKNSRISAVAITDEQLCRLVLGKLKEEHIL